MKKIIAIAATIITLSLFLSIIFATDSEQLPAVFQQAYNFPGGDKVGHLLVMGVVSFAVIFSLRAISDIHRTAVTTVLVGSLLILFTGEEISQAFIPVRTFSFLDLFFSYCGLTLGTVLAIAGTQKRKATHG